MAWPERRPSLRHRPLSNGRSVAAIRRPLSHRTSTSSVQGNAKRDSIDAEISRRDATAAAQYAYARAEERKSMSGADLGFSNSVGLSRGNSTGAHSVVTVRRSDSNRFVEHGGVHTSASSGNGLKRQQSVRFAGPNAIPRRQSLVRRQSLDQVRPLQRSFAHARSTGGKTTSVLKPRALTVEDAVLAEYRPPSRSSSIGKSSLGRSVGRSNARGKVGSGTESFVTALADSAVYDEYYAITQEDDIASTPSSYRRIRRSKSMFSPGKTKSIMSAAKERGSIQYSNGTPSPGGLKRSQSFLNRGAAGLKFQKSMSFLRGGKERQRASSVREDQDVAIAMARDKFLRQVEQQRLREQPSFLFRANKRREEHSAVKPFRKSVRSGSDNSGPFGKPISSDNQHSSKDEDPKTLKGKARKVSKSFRKRLKGLFTKGSGESEEAAIPEQQVIAHETHVVATSPYTSAASDISHGQGAPYDNIPCPTPDKIQSVAARVGSLHAAASTQQLRSRKGSVQSLRSDASGTGSNCSKSRVTSWTSTNETVVSAGNRNAMLERERQRLSIIQENGTHVSSSSFQRPPLRNQFSAYPLIERRENQQLQGGLTRPVDSQRVYSALMRRLDENSPHKLTARQLHQQASEEGLVVPPRMGSLVCSHSHGGLAEEISPTLWAVPPSTSASRTSLRDDEIKPLGREFKTYQVNDSDDVFSPAKDVPTAVTNYNDIDTHRKRACGSISSQTTLVPKKASYSPFPHREPGDKQTFFTPQEIADRIEGGRPVHLKDLKSAATVRESKSTFFPHTGDTIQRTTSPYRRALAVSDYKPDWKSDYHPAVAKENRPRVEAVDPTRGARSDTSVKGSEICAPRNSEHTIYSESIYSRTTGEEPAEFEDEVKVNRRKDGSGTAVLIEQEVYRPTHRPTPFESGGKNQVGHRLASSAGSIEWKKWMSAEVAALERIKEPETAMRISYALPSMPKSYGASTSSESPSNRSSMRHVREKAQISDDDTSVSQGKVALQKQPLGILQSLRSDACGSSYSLRPPLKPKSILKKASQASISTVFTEAPSISIPPVPLIPARAPLRETQSRCSMRSGSSAATISRIPSSNIETRNGNENGTIAYSGLLTSSNGRQFLHKRSNATLRSIDNINTPSKKLVKRSVARKNSNTAMAMATTVNVNMPLVSPGGLSMAVEKQFGSIGTIGGGRSASLGIQGGNENVHPTSVAMFQAQVQSLVGQQRSDRGEETGAAGNGAKHVDAQAMGSKRMVDLFLSSRRRRVAGSEEESASAFV